MLEVQTNVTAVPLKNLKISDWNVRLTDRDKYIEDLAESIRKHGQLQPILITGEEPPYEIVVGQRRYRAVKYLGDKTIDAVFFTPKDNIQATILSLAENMHRVDLNYADKADAITKLYKHFGKDEKRVSRELGIGLKTVREYIKIEEQATPKLQRLLREKRVSKVDALRVIEVAQGNKRKTDEFIDKIDKIRELSKHSKTRLVEYGMKNPHWSANKLIEEAQKARIRPVITLNLTDELDKALDKAKHKLSIEREEIALKAITEWLNKNGFLYE